MLQRQESFRRCHHGNNFGRVSTRCDVSNRHVKLRKNSKFKLLELEYICIKRWFVSLEDCWNGGRVPTSVISNALLAQGVFASRNHADTVINHIETDRTGSISCEEFVAAVDNSNIAVSLRRFLRCLVREYADPAEPPGHHMIIPHLQFNVSSDTEMFCHSTERASCSAIPDTPALSPPVHPLRHLSI